MIKGMFDIDLRGKRVLVRQDLNVPKKMAACDRRHGLMLLYLPEDAS